MLDSSLRKPSFENGNTVLKLSLLERSKLGVKKIFGILLKSNCGYSEKKYFNFYEN